MTTTIDSRVLHKVDDPKSPHLAFVSDDVFFCLSLRGGHSASPLGDLPRDGVEAMIRRFRPNHDVHMPRYAPGDYHPRVWRGPGGPGVQPASAISDETNAAHHQAWVASGVAVLPLFDELGAVFGVIEPRSENAAAYGHRLRHLLLLACTEVEAAWKGVLLANNYARPEDRLSTQDYVRLQDPLRLAEWDVRLEAFPAFPSQRPFADWEPARPTDSLPWYDAYNAVKHDRESTLSRASLEQVVSAMAALHIMMCAQFGPDALRPFNPPATARFLPSSTPAWGPTEQYFAPSRQWPAPSAWTEVNLSL